MKIIIVKQCFSRKFDFVAEVVEFFASILQRPGLADQQQHFCFYRQAFSCFLGKSDEQRVNNK